MRCVNNSFSARITLLVSPPSSASHVTINAFTVREQYHSQPTCTLRRRLVPSLAAGRHTPRSTTIAKMTTTPSVADYVRSSNLRIHIFTHRHLSNLAFNVAYIYLLHNYQFSLVVMQEIQPFRKHFVVPSPNNCRALV